VGEPVPKEDISISTNPDISISRLQKKSARPFRNIQKFVIVIAFDRRGLLTADRKAGSSNISPGALLAARRPKGTRRLQSVPVVDSPAPVAELVDALDSGSSGRKPVEVRVLSGALSATPYGTPCTAQVLKLVDRPD
jgi:hypothetical protein